MKNRPRVFDAHFHIIDPRFPLIPNQNFMPEHFTVHDYRLAIETVPMHVVGGAVVSGSFQGFDHSYLEAVLPQLGPSFVGVIQLRNDATDAEIMELHQYGVRAARFNLRRGNGEHADGIVPLAQRIFDLVGWHAEVYLDGAQLPDLLPKLMKIPRLVIDHLGLSSRGWNALLRLISLGAFVKASGFGRLDFDVRKALRQVVSINPHSLIFGTDLPSTRAPRPFDPTDLEMVMNCMDDTTARRVLLTNALNLYGVDLPN